MSYAEIVVLTILVLPLVCCLEAQYHNNAELETYLKNFTKNSGDVKATLYSIGKTVKGNHLWVVNISAAEEQIIGIPNIKFVGTIHGNEPVGREILLYFMEYLRDNYRTNSEIRWLLNHTRIHILPSLNPDGFAEAYEDICGGDNGRFNGKRSVDLNRNFPDYFHRANRRMPDREAETKAVMQWMTDVPFILSAGLHGGALVANYPFDTVKEETSDATQPPSPTPDDDVFKHLATVYAQNHQTMHEGKACPNDKWKFPGGITNGAAWYTFPGGMQDYNYAFHGCMEVTLEISCCKYPPRQELPKFWKENKKALLKYSIEAHRGVTGQILDGTTSEPVVNASLKISGRNISFSSKRRGEFWRLLLPGIYKLEVSAEGYHDQIVPFVVKDCKNSSMPELAFLKISLINSSISTTTTETTTQEQQTTEKIRSVKETSLDGASTIDFVTDEVPVVDMLQSRAISTIGFGDVNGASLSRVLHCFLSTLLLCLVFV